MLIRFNVENFLSFHSNQEFSMISGEGKNKHEHIYEDDNIKLLKFAAIYGANASGKSNLVEALEFMKETVTEGFPEGHTTKYCKNNPENKDRNSFFELELKLSGRYYAYGFEASLNTSCFVEEWLVEICPDNTEREIFVRNTVEGTYRINSYFQEPAILTKLEIYADDIKRDDTILFLDIMNRNKGSLYEAESEVRILNEIYIWFRDKLDINYPDRPISDYSYFATNENAEEISRVISAFGTGITGFRLVDVSSEKMSAALPRDVLLKLSHRLEKENSTNKKQQSGRKSGILFRGSQKEFYIVEMDEQDRLYYKTIEFSHSGNKTLFRLAEESDGTIRTLDLIEILLSKEQEKVYVIDEIDRCLHPQLTYKLVETFLDMAKQRNIQLIVTTHESRLMDFQLLRRDEIWFVEKDSSGESTIYSLEEYHSRFDQNVDLAYLEGRYGGIPVFDSLLSLKEE